MSQVMFKAMSRVLAVAGVCAFALPGATYAADTADPLAAGKAIALQAKAQLGGELVQAINREGTVGAVEFCNAQALAITEDLSVKLGASIKRVSDRPRNVENVASSAELRYIAMAKAALADGRGAEPRMHEVDGKWVGYYPIVTNGLCLQCHGTPTVDVKGDTLSILAAKYPDDQALGYGVNELRGIWVIAMEKTGERAR